MAEVAFVDDDKVEDDGLTDKQYLEAILLGKSSEREEEELTRVGFAEFSGDDDDVEDDGMTDEQYLALILSRRTSRQLSVFSPKKGAGVGAGLDATQTTPSNSKADAAQPDLSDEIAELKKMVVGLKQAVEILEQNKRHILSSRAKFKSKLHGTFVTLDRAVQNTSEFNVMYRAYVAEERAKHPRASILDVYRKDFFSSHHKTVKLKP